MKTNISPIVYIGILLYFIQVSQSCSRQEFGKGNIVCVCNETYCDYVGPLEKPTDSQTYLVYTSNSDGLRLAKTTGIFRRDNNTRKHTKHKRTHKGNQIEPNEIRLNYTKTFQTIIGFGGAFTDSTGININSLGDTIKKHFLRSYFSQDGIEYSLGRIPIGGTDFSLRGYSYDDGPEDLNLQRFSLQKEDEEYKIPLIKEAKKLSKDLRLFASAWIAPKWMKTNEDYVGGEIKPTMYQLWADYHLRFLEEYKKIGIEMWGITTGNEPNTALFPATLANIPSNYWSPTTMSKWVSENLGPTIRNSNHSAVKIMALDDQRFNFPLFFNIFFQNNKTFNYVDGLAVHWYFDMIISAEALSVTHKFFPSKFILGTEACEGSFFFSKGPRLGDWSRATSYAKFIIQDLQHWVTGWTDWNMALNRQGGPTYIDNFVDSPIIVDGEKKVFYKQPMFYAMGHFSKFIPKDSVRIDVRNHIGLDIVAFKRPDGATSIVILNEKSSSVQLVIKGATRGDILQTITPKSITTIVHW